MQAIRLALDLKCVAILFEIVTHHKSQCSANRTVKLSRLRCFVWEH